MDGRRWTERCIESEREKRGGKRRQIEIESESEAESQRQRRISKKRSRDG